MWTPRLLCDPGQTGLLSSYLSGPCCSSASPPAPGTLWRFALRPAVPFTLPLLPTASHPPTQIQLPSDLGRCPLPAAAFSSAVTVSTPPTPSCLPPDTFTLAGAVVQDSVRLPFQCPRFHTKHFPKLSGRKQDFFSDGYQDQNKGELSRGHPGRPLGAWRGEQGLDSLLSWLEGIRKDLT